ncbi:prepronociceptin [Microcaecilia unicolor]|uniref:Prepronociceptin n=1 Tax=Microcaecilia unicolor TaxID=1415580 RepID=A0A6P7XDW5_9AMPH|nr:prepronociceptin [Microcaecilia unicolor]
MKTLLWTLVLLCLFANVLSDCQRDCLICKKHLYQQDDFNTLVCIVECEGEAYSSVIWKMCKKVLKKTAVQLSVDSMEDNTYNPLETEDGLFRSNLKHLEDLTKVVDLSKIENEKRISKISGLIQEQEEDNTIERSETPLHMTSEPDAFSDLQGQSRDITKRYGGFLKGKYSYRKFLEPARGMQKRYGGFIGVRKSARKWNNQKRFSEFLKQYLGMSTRSSGYDSLSADINEENEI